MGQALDVINRPQHIGGALRFRIPKEPSYTAYYADRLVVVDKPDIMAKAMHYVPKKYYIKTLGCQANVADANIMAGILEALGFEPVACVKEYKNEHDELSDLLPQTDLFIVNTCSVRQKSEDKVYGLGKIFFDIKARRQKPPFAIISGCMVGSVTGTRQRYDFELLKNKTIWADAYINPSQVFDLPNVLKEHGLLSAWAEKKLTEKLTSIKHTESFQPKSEHAYINISYGCDNFCTYCVVPYAREAEVSRSEKELLAEINYLVSRGTKKITLCGQNVNSWGLSRREKFKIRSGSDQKLPFADLLRKIHAVDDLELISFISSNPFDFTQDLIDVLKLPKISNYLHIAVQSGNNEILKKMNRRHTIEEFEDLLEKIKLVRPDIEFGTDIIVGFPGETEKQFMGTVDLLNRQKFNVAFISMYSPRKGTMAEKLYKDDIPLKEKKRRHKYLTKVWRDSLSKKH